MTNAEHDDALQDALVRIERLSEERDALEALTLRQAEEIEASRKTLLSARRHMLVTDAARVAQWEWDVPSGRIFLSTRWDEMIGDASPDSLWDIRELLSRVHPEDVRAVRAAFEAALSGNNPRYLVEHRVAAATGWIWIESIGMITERDAAGAPLKLTGYNRDITARREMLAEIDKARAEAEESSRAKGEFLANMSHEVRTPLNAILGLTRLLHKSKLDAEQRRYLQLVDSSATALLGLLNDVLDLSKIEAGKLVFEQIRFDVERWINDVVALHVPAAEKKGVSVDIDIAPDVPPVVVGDPGRLRQVMSNLMSNAIKFTERGSIHVTLAVDDDQGDLPPRRQRLLFSVRDTGIGISEDKQQQIFEAFTQADASTTRRHGGTGLGLAICARLVNMMEGEVRVESRPQKGSTFSFTAVFDEANDDFSVLSEPAPLDMPTVHGLNVLLAEDHAVNELLMRRLLGDMGCTFTVVRNGEEAVSAWQRQRFDLVLMDVQMPVMSGFDATAQIRAREAAMPGRPRTPIVALTAHAMAGDRERCLAEGMDGYVSKPVSPARLAEAMQSAMRASSEVPEVLVPEFDFDLSAFPSRPAPVAPVSLSAPSARKTITAVVTAPAPLASVPAPERKGASTLDLARLMETMGNDMASVHELAGVMREDIALRRRAIRKASIARDVPVLLQHVHALKGAFSAIFALGAAQASRQLETAVRAEQWIEVLYCVNVLDREATRVDVDLEKLLA
ncbi:signal transduction histidine kinase/DNA-binding NarL/FixJ family response regulator [Variovorax sp. GrIS 2.14]|uniref:PAS domain-containing hybrid sensor histidine kinase/response regulator n=1 Tax=Variovorax sp. GrIS 2.14 TaxID=3071709 RepID=UPI0038F61692